MANINKIRISGTSYDIQDKNAPSVSAVTQEQYDNLPSSAKTSNTFFVITDAQAGDLTQYYTKTETNALLGGKVDTSSVVTAVTSGSTDSEIPTAKAVNDKLGGLKLQQITQAAYSAMEQAGTLDNSTLYIVIDS